MIQSLLTDACFRSASSNPKRCAMDSQPKCLIQGYSCLNHCLTKTETTAAKRIKEALGQDPIDRQPSRPTTSQKGRCSGCKQSICRSTNSALTPPSPNTQCPTSAIYPAACACQPVTQVRGHGLASMVSFPDVSPCSRYHVRHDATRNATQTLPRTMFKPRWLV